MWAQQWNKIYPDILKPYPRASIETADTLLAAQKWDAGRMAHSAESFYTSLGFPQLPRTFWERSMLTRPRGPRGRVSRQCLGLATTGDVRIKACLKPTEQDLFTIYHELGPRLLLPELRGTSPSCFATAPTTASTRPSRHGQSLGDARVPGEDRTRPRGHPEPRGAHSTSR